MGIRISEKDEVGVQEQGYSSLRAGRKSFETKERMRRRRDLQPSFQVSVKNDQNSKERFWNSKKVESFMNFLMTKLAVNFQPKYR